MFRLVGPQHHNSKLQKERFDHETLLAEARGTIDQNQVRTHYADRLLEASGFVEDFEEMIDDLATYVDCLMDLAPALENPALDQSNRPHQVRESESLNVSLN